MNRLQWRKTDPGLIAKLLVPESIKWFLNLDRRTEILLTQGYLGKKKRKKKLLIYHHHHHYHQKEMSLLVLNAY